MQLAVACLFAEEDKEKSERSGANNSRDEQPSQSPRNSNVVKSQSAPARQASSQSTDPLAGYWQDEDDKVHEIRFTGEYDLNRVGMNYFVFSVGARFFFFYY